MEVLKHKNKELEIKLPCSKITFISEEDSWILKEFPHWRFSGNYCKVSRYIKTEYGKAKEEYFIHRLIIGVVKGFEVDHINRNKLDNRRSNLRLASRGENSQNKAKAKNTTSKYRGVCYRPKLNKSKPWTGYISKNGKRFELGYFDNEVDAAKAYNKKAKELWGEFAYENKI